MSKPIATHRHANSISAGVFLISLGILFYTKAWWPGILLALLVSIGIKDYLRGRIYDLFLSIFVLGGLFIFFFFNAEWFVTIPVLLTVGGIWIIFRELFVRKERMGEEEAEDISHEVSEDEKDET